MSKWGGGGVWSEMAWGGFLGGDDKQQGVFCQGFFWVKFRGGVESGGGGVHEGGFVVGSFSGFGQRVCIGVWPGR